MSLRTRSIFETPSLEDGLRICVMSRLTKKDGVTPETKIIPGTSFDGWAQHLGPPDKLVGWWYRENADPKNWSEFERGYLTHIRRDAIAPSLYIIGQIAKIQPVTLLCAEREPDYCHRRPLAEEIARRVSGLDVKID